MPRDGYVERMNRAIYGLGEQFKGINKMQQDKEKAEREAELFPMQKQLTESQAGIAQRNFRAEIEKERIGEALATAQEPGFKGVTSNIGGMEEGPVNQDVMEQRKQDNIDRLQASLMTKSGKPTTVQDIQLQRKAQMEKQKYAGSTFQKDIDAQGYFVAFNDKSGKMERIKNSEGQPIKAAQTYKTLETPEGILRIGTKEAIAKPQMITGVTGLGAEELRLKKEKGVREEKDLAMRKERASIDKIKAAEAHRAMKLKKASELESLNEFSNLADKLFKSEYLRGITGVGRIGQIIPGTKWADVSADMDKLLAMGAIQTMARLKAESGSTGFGSMSEKELAVLQNSFAALQNRNQSPEKMRKELKRLSDKTKAYIKKINDYESELGIESETKKSKSIEVAPGITIERID